MTFKFSVRPHFKTPRRLAKNPRLTIAQLVRRIPNETRRKSRAVAIETVGYGPVPRILAGYTTYKIQTRNMQNGHQYRLTVYSPTPKVTIDSKVIIDSPCPAYVFRYEYSVATRGNGFIFRTNGQPPVQTNPGNIPGVDHHMYKALSYLIRNTNNRGLRGQPRT